MKTEHTEQNEQQTLRIEQYGLMDYSKALADAILQGYALDFETNQHCPVAYGGFFTATLVKPSKKIKTADELLTEEPEPEQEQQSTQRRGRKPADQK